MDGFSGSSCGWSARRLLVRKDVGERVMLYNLERSIRLVAGIDFVKRAGDRPA